MIVTRRPKYACRTCEKTGADEIAGIVQAPAPARSIAGGLPTEALVADVLVSKYADHLPLYRQSQILARDGIDIDRSTLATGSASRAVELEPLHERLVATLKALDEALRRRDTLPGARSGTGQDQDRLSLGDRAR